MAARIVAAGRMPILVAKTPKMGIALQLQKNSIIKANSQLLKKRYWPWYRCS